MIAKKILSGYWIILKVLEGRGIVNVRMEEWENTLKEIFNEIDDYLEDMYGGLYPLHPSRSSRGATANKSYDGLFDVGASFSAGYGSQYGRGWIFDIHIATLTQVSSDIRDKIYDDAVRILQALLSEHYPDRNIRVEKDGSVFKIFGDLKILYKKPD